MNFIMSTAGQRRSWSLYHDFLEAFESLTYNGIPLALFVHFSHYFRMKPLEEKLNDPNIDKILKNKVVHPKEIQSKIDRIMKQVATNSNNKTSNGKILLYDEVNLRFREKNYVEFYNSSTTTILRENSTSENYLGIPIHSLEEYKSNVTPLIKSTLEKANKILISYNRHPVFGMTQFQKRFQNDLHNILERLVAVNNFFEKVPISCVIVGGSADYIQRMLIVIAAANEIPSIYIQHGMISASRGFLPVFATIQGVYGQYEKVFYVRAGVSKDRIKIIGHPSFDTIFTDPPMSKSVFIEKLKILSNKKIVLIPTQPTMPIDSLKRLIKHLLRFEYIEIILKLHPNELKQHFTIEKYRRLSKQYRAVKIVLDEFSLYDTIANADVVCVYYSTTGIESMLFGKPVVYFAKNPFDGAPYDYCDQLVEPNPYKLGNLIVRLVNNKQFKQLAEIKRKEFIAKAYPNADELSGKRLSDLIYEITGIRSYQKND
ncbi:capsular polysaccharide export protein, LipB/KpsS family [Halalkalibacter alkalisediminis]|uniref:CDP-glycerol glycerophosphotransferase family protein n=1 Tax=Halalkalibacter alkalisediminis TaxID=935616 RepID=A0ABV6NPA3_9BACI|nr:CDP-glycerol glycerophosphotransferase family protein [Halalkalibacter alkalisediminis]